MALPRDTQDLLDALDRYKETRGTLAIFDGLWAGDPARVYTAFADNLNHPLAEPLTAWLAARGIARPQRPSNDEVLEQKGVVDVAGWIEKHEKELLKLRRERDTAVLQRSDALKVANGLAVILVAVAAAGVLGWLAAFGALPFNPLEIPEGRPLPHDGSGSGAQEEASGDAR